MHRQARSARSRLLIWAPGILALLAVVAIATPAVAQESTQLRGIFMNPGDTAFTAITPPGDVDTFVFDALADSELVVEVRSQNDKTLEPGIVLLAPDGSAIDISDRLVERRRKAKIRKLVLERTGRYGLQVTGRGESEGDYRLKLWVTPPSVRTEKFSLSPLKLANVRFGADANTVINAKVTTRGGPVFVVHVVDPKSNEIPGANRLFEEQEDGSLQARLFPTQNSGNYYLGLRGNLDTTIDVKVKIRTKHTPPIAQKRYISKFEPVVDELVPNFGREGNGIAIQGRNFLPGKITVLFGTDEAPSAFYVNDGKINVIVPPEGDETIVDVTVYNPDGQSGSKEQAFTFIPPPPQITTILPTEGPDIGGTEVEVSGQNMTFVETIEMGDVPISTVPTIVDSQLLSFITDAHPPGTVTVTLTDQFGQSAFKSQAFTFAAEPSILAITPTAGTVKGGTGVIVSGAGFRSDQTVTIDGIPVAFTVVTQNQLVFTTPPHSLGDVDIVIEDLWGRRAVAAKAFSYVTGTLIDISSKFPTNTDTDTMTGLAIGIGDVDKGSIGGRVDIVLGGKVQQPTNTRLFLNQGTRWELDTANKFDTDNSYDVELGDLDGDTDLDLVVVQPELTVNSFSYNWYTYPQLYYFSQPYIATRIFTNDGQGRFSLSQNGMPSNRQFSSGKPIKSDLFAGESLALGDVDGDSDLDLVVTGRSVPYVSNFTKSAYYSWAYTYYFTYYTDPTFSSTRLLINDGTGRFKHAPTQMPAVSGDLLAGDDVIVADVDGDGDRDIVVTGDSSDLRDPGKPEYTAGSKTRILLNDGKGTFTNATASLMPATSPEDDWGGLGVGVGDLDGDKDVEIVITSSRALTNYLGERVSSTRVFEKGTSAFTHQTTKFMPTVNADGTGDSFRAVSIAVGDPDGNGIDEIFLILDEEVYGQDPDSGNWDKQVSSLRWIGRKTSLPLSNLTSGQVPSPDITGDHYLGHRVKIGDLDGDGDLDMVITTTLPGYSQSGDRPTRVFEFR